ncbi:glycosyltransferase family 2 protein [Lysobacter sp. HA35]
MTTYNWKDALAAGLRSIARQSQLPREVIVADDGSRNETGELVRELAVDYPISLVHVWQEDSGFRAARVRNLGIARSTGDYVIFVDGDMVLHPHFVADHLRHARRGTFLQGGRLNASPDESRRLLSGGTPRFSPFMPFAEDLHGELKREHAFRSNWVARRRARGRGRGVVMSCNLGVWRDDLLHVNGFDEAYEGWGREDDDLATRLGHAGVEQRDLRYAGLAIHLWHDTRRPTAADPSSARIETPNDALLEAARRERRIRCTRGVDTHLPTGAVAAID